MFRTHTGGDSSLWLARRIQAHGDDTPRFEITVLSKDGIPHTRLLHVWQLGWDYRVLRSTQFPREDTWTTMPRTFGGLIGFFPLGLVFPLGTFAAGVLLWRRGRNSGSVAPAV